MVDAKNLQQSADLVVVDYLRLLRDAKRPAPIKSAQQEIALSLKELIDNAVEGEEAARMKRKLVPSLVAAEGESGQRSVKTAIAAAMGLVREGDRIRKMREMQQQFMVMAAFAMGMGAGMGF